MKSTAFCADSTSISPSAIALAWFAVYAATFWMGRWIAARKRDDVLLVSLTIAFSVAAGPVYGLAARAAQQLLDRDGYVRAVLGEGGQRAAR